MTTLITGGAGFVGLNVARQLMLAGEVVVIYDLGNIKPNAHADLNGLSGSLRVEQGSVLDKSHLADVIARYRVNQVVHGAAITAGLERERTQASDILQVNTLGTINVLECVLDAGIQRIVQLGTGSVFGSSVKQEGMLHESIDVPEPDSLYGISKYAAERIAMRYRATRGLDVVVARLGVVFGRYEHDTGLRDTLSAPLTLGQLALSGQHASVYANLPDDWVYATDVAIAVEMLLNAATTSHGIYQVSSGMPWSVGQWCHKLKHQFPAFTFDLVDQKELATVGSVTPTRRPLFSIDRLSKEFGYRPQFLIDDAFDDYAQWFDSHQKT
ncbi:MAG: NAD(P)-dependent oxidoreductase [Burkholderiales bacterium]|jgi:nucleoside-diphosphate-sugar epimerase|uniref:NAD-dependent epimerase/dehydratase family protein n=1 Tax=Orrella sp. TaxID=1921583 RepID=UPI00277A49B1|nr:NAD(P)-dependent oxidoreductase [Burkholderiales bacterium]